MASADEIRRLEFAVREAQANLDRARAENARADQAWERMVRAAEQSVAQGKSVTAEFIITSAKRAKAEGSGSVIPLHRLTGEDIVRGMNMKGKPSK
jgi:hypothetical protein